MKRNQSFRLKGNGFVEALENRTLLSAGDLDPSYSGNGKQAISFGEGIDAKAFDVAVQSDGKTVVVGRASGTGIPLGDFAVARFNVDGTPDTSFGPNGNGTLHTHVGSNKVGSGAAAVAIQPDGRIVVVGSGAVANDEIAMAIARFMPDGSPDTSFSGDGELVESLDNQAGASDVLILDNGKILVAGELHDSSFLKNDFNDDFVVVRFNTDGSLDDSFGDDGKRRIDFGSDEEATALTLDFNGTKETNPFFGGIVVVGKGPENVAGTSRSFAIARLKPNGSLDDRFDDDGKVSRGITGTLGSGAEDVIIQSNGKIIVCGAVARTDTPENRRFALLRFRRSGQLDTTFGDAGTGLIEIPFGNDARAFSLARSTERGILVGGVSDKHMAIARISSEGTVDKTFGILGGVITEFGNNATATFGLARGPGKRFTAAGGSFFASARYLEAGANVISISSIDPNAFEKGANPASVFITRVERLPTPVTVGFTVTGTASHPGDYTCPNIGGSIIGGGTVSSDLSSSAVQMGPFANAAREVQPLGFVSPLLKTGQVTIPAGQTFAVVTITPVNDTAIEGNETAIFTLRDGTNYDLDDRPSSTLTIFDAQSTTLNPIADALVKQGTNADVNFGSSKTLQARNKTDANRRSYLKFDMSSIGPLIQSVKLRLFGNLESLTESNIVSSVHSVADTTWEESAITFNNKPAPGSPALSQTTIIDNTFRWYEWDVTAYVRAEMAAGRDIISLVVRNATTSDALASFNSSEAALNKPQLLFIPRTFISI